MNGRVGLAMVVALLASACSHYVKDFKPEPVAQEFLPRFQLSSDVTVVGVFRDVSSEVVVLAKGAGKWYANDNELVSTAVMVARDILTQNNVALTQTASKVLKISFVDASFELGAWSNQINLKFQVRAGDKITKEFIGLQNIGTIHWGIEAAVSDAMIKVFSDPQILDYLKN